MLDLDQQLLLAKNLHDAEKQIIDLKNTMKYRAQLQDAVIEKLRQRIKFAIQTARTFMTMESYKQFIAKMDLHEFEQYEQKTK